MSHVREIKVPDIGDFDKVDVIEILVSVGDVVALDDSLLTLESDKASMEIPSPVAGKVASLEVAVGDQVGEGDVVAKVEVSETQAAGEGSAEDGDADNGAAEGVSSVDEPAADQAGEEPKAKAPGPAEEAEPEASAGSASPVQINVEASSTEDGAGQPSQQGSQTGPAAQSRGQTQGTPPHASPSVRRFARELGVDLQRVSGSGSKGRILRIDVEALVKSVMSGSTAGGQSQAEGSGIPVVPAIDFSKFGTVTEQPLSRIQRAAARNLWRSWVNVPHVTQFDEADVTELEVFRKSLKAEAEKREVKLTPLAFLMKAAVKALQEFPTFNSSLHPSGESLIVKSYYHLGIAVDTPKGLVVPVIRDVDQKSLYDLAGELGEISERARAGKLSPNDIQGASFTISSLGGIGGTNFTPIVNAPEVAILGVARSKWQPVYDGEGFEPRLILPFSVSYDHRVIDGAAGVRFTGFLSSVLSDVRRMIL